METNNNNSHGTRLYVLISVSVLLLVLIFSLVGLLFLQNSKPSSNDNDSRFINNITDEDLKNSISSCALALSGCNNFGDECVADYLTYFCKSNSAEHTNSLIEASLNRIRGDDSLNYSLFSDDYDNDGDDEYIFTLSNCGAWAKKIGSQYVLNSINDLSSISGKDKTIYIYCDTYNNIAVYQFFVTDCCTGNVKHCKWDSDCLKIETNNGKAAFFVCDASRSINDTDLADRYSRYLEDTGYRYIYYTNASLCTDDSTQSIFVYGYDTYSYDSAVCVLKYGRCIPIFSVDASDNMALYLLNRDDSQFLLTYKNWNSSGTICYEYKRFVFNKNHSVNTIEAVTVKGDDANNANKVESFFTNFKSLTNKAIVCTDPYQLTGYTTYFNRTETQTQKTDYLQISNCDTSKSGIVTIDPKPKNWLNLRVSPGVSSAKVNVNGGIVKQANGSVVTVLDTVNTDDAKNPIWVKAQINYGGEIITGYSSQTYITLPGIRHIKVGESFAITADSNNSSLSWRVNDSTVASIGSSSGTITGHKHGLVLVTVTSASGLTDSCLVAVD